MLAGPSTVTAVAGRFGFTQSTMSRHSREHLGFDKQNLRGKRGCVICKSGAVADIDAALRAGDVAVYVARRHDLSPSAMSRHKLGCLRLDRVVRQCVVCRHPDVERIDIALLSDKPRSTVAHAWGLSPHSITHHAGMHLGYASGATPNACRVCCSPDRSEIEALAAKFGPSSRMASLDFGIAREAVWKHMQSDHAMRAAERAASRLDAVQRYVSRSLT